MNYKSMIRTALVIFGVIIVLNLTSFAQDSNKLEPDDKELILKVYAALKVNYDDQISHINVRADASDGVVILEGWVAKSSEKKKIEKMIKKMDGVNCVVVAKLKVGKGVGCGPGQQECGGTCISSKDACTICLNPSKCP